MSHLRNTVLHWLLTMKAIFCWSVLFTVLGASNVDSSRILGIFPMPYNSHFRLGEKLLKELASRGHKVTMISPFPQKTKVKNYRDVSLESFLEIKKKEGSMSFFEKGKKWPIQQITMIHTLAVNIANLTMTHPKVEKLLKSDAKFDLVIALNFMNEFHIGFAHHYKCSFILLSTLCSNSLNNNFVSNPAPYSYVPEIILEYSSKMNFFQRLHNVYYGLYLEIFRYFYFLPMQDELLHIYFKDAPPLDELLKNISLVLLNSHPVTSDPVPHVPSQVEIGGFHVDDVKPLPKDLQDHMDSAKEGVILFSLGSNLKSIDLAVEKRNAILKTFSKLKQKVLWKWEDDVLPGQPPNVKLSKWLPQNDIMAHPNLRAFVTHGGLLSKIEALHHGVPLVGIPIFADQKMNMAHVVNKQYGLTITYNELDEEKFTHALNEVLYNPIYLQNIRKKSAILRDQPLRPIDTAVFWVEHVLRHKGGEHFRTAAQDLHWIQLYLIDVILFSAIVFFSVTLLLFISFSKLFGNKKITKNDKKKKMV